MFAAQRQVLRGVVRSVANRVKRHHAGARSRDARTTSTDQVASAPSHSAPGSGYEFERRDQIRLEVMTPHVPPGAVGIEIGAGAFPSRLPTGVRCEYFDKRGREAIAEYFGGIHGPDTHSLEEMRSRFPVGADFLIAHNVLEHTANPIQTLLEWFGHVKPSGVVILSLPHREFCPGDSQRPVADIEHLLLDYALGETATSFGSREHFIAGCVGWAADWPEVPKNEFASGVLTAAGMDDIEHHFHAFDDALALRVVESALWLHGKGHTRTFASPYTDPATVGDIIFILSLTGDPTSVAEVHEAAERLGDARDRLRRAAPHARHTGSGPAEAR